MGAIANGASIGGHALGRENKDTVSRAPHTAESYYTATFVHRVVKEPEPWARQVGRTKRNETKRNARSLQRRWEYYIPWRK